MGFFKSPEEKKKCAEEKLLKGLFSKDIERVKASIAAGADVNFHDQKDDQTPLFHALSSQRYDVAKVLMDAGADIHFIQESTGTSLLCAATRNYSEPYEVGKMLIEQGAPLDTAQLSNGWTAMHHAAEHAHGRLIKLMLEHGADDKLTDSRMNTPYDIANKSSWTQQIARMLSEHAAARAPQPGPAVQATQTVEPPAPKAKASSDWHLTEEAEVAHISDKAAIGYRITEIFNFNARCYTRIARNLDTGAESQVMRLFGELSGASAILEAAKEELLALGGTLPEADAVLKKPVMPAVPVEQKP